eukprot:1709840-Alexandrium_andersonii.AAC.1
MSASLVGSEMCIRDRASSSPSESLTIRESCALMPWASASTLACVASWSCLLYTSDAADDM